MQQGLALAGAVGTPEGGHCAGTRRVGMSGKAERGMHRPAVGTANGPTNTRTEDQALVESVARGDTAAFEALYDRHAAQAYGLALKVSHSRQIAEEATQDAFLSLWQRPSSYQSDKGTLTAYLLRTVHNRAVDAIRHEESIRRREQAGTITLDEPIEDEPAELAWVKVRRDHVRAAMTQLSPAHRQALELTYLGGLTCTEIADHLSIPLGTAKTRIRDGMIRLRRLLADSHIAEP
jgi:RNA polymerase sigma-70 factor, ECF subfamily